MRVRPGPPGQVPPVPRMVAQRAEQLKGPQSAVQLKVLGGVQAVMEVEQQGSGQEQDEEARGQQQAGEQREMQPDEQRRELKMRLG